MRLLLGLALCLCPAAFSAPHPITIAVIDTGFDLDHEALRSRVVEGETDEEGASATAPGWDWKDNSHLKQPLLTGAPLQEVLLYRTLKAKFHREGLAPPELAWMERKKADPDFKALLRTFKRHVHGTSVAGIALQGEGLSMLPLKAVGVDVPTVVIEGDGLTLPTQPLLQRSEAEFHRQVRLSEERVIHKMRHMLDAIARTGAPVVNASYGVTEKHTLRRFADLHREITGLDLDPIKLREVVDGYFSRLYARGGELLDRHPRTLFVFSAGNSGQDNDIHHHFPSRVRRPHVLSVGALNGSGLASFSNWGLTSVDTAAPGVGVPSLVPQVYAKHIGVEHIPSSGTSMAAPFVANVAARCLQLNPDLRGATLKDLLLQTGTPVPDLLGKSTSGRAVDAPRALHAAKLSQEHAVEAAIRLAWSRAPASDRAEASVSTPPTSSVR